jgi:hypothetical protein
MQIWLSGWMIEMNSYRKFVSNGPCFEMNLTSLGYATSWGQEPDLPPFSHGFRGNALRITAQPTMFSSYHVEGPKKWIFSKKYIPVWFLLSA